MHILPGVTKNVVKLIGVVLLTGGAGLAQLSSSAYRVLGQTDFRQNGLNMVQGIELNQPSSIALDSRNGQTHLYISDTGNSRVLAWRDVNAYQIGDAPTLVLGQPGPQYSAALGIGTKGFTGVTGLAVDPTTGNLYVADTGNNRVLRFVYPFANLNRAEPDAVFGQPSFTTRGAATTNNGLNQPRGLALDGAGNLWIADTGNHRVVRYPASALNSPTQPAADMVVGQRDFSSGNANAGGQISASGFDTPVALAFDAQNNLYVSDFNNTRVLRFAGPLNSGSANLAASAVWGQSNFASRGVPQQATASSLGGPVGITVDGNGNLYVSVPRDNRVLVFPVSTATGAAASNMLGQTDPAGTTANAGAAPLASPSSLAQPADVKTDSAGNVFVIDSANHRVLQFPAGGKSAARVWGQSDFVSNAANQIKPGSINFPYKMAIDYSSAPFALYVSDTGNHRILVWKDSVRFRSGDAADLVIGQPNLRTGAANVDSQGSGKPTQTSLFAPEGIALNPYDGTLYVADAGNNRVLRYPRPVAQTGRITPDAVIGQPDFTSSDSALVTAGSLKNPAGIALGANGNLFVSDSGNNRVLEYPAGAGYGASAIRVYGQPSMASSIRASQVSAQTLSGPQGIAVDAASNLYVADAGANRVLIFPNTQNAPIAGMPATFVLGQPEFGTATGGSIKSPGDVAVDSVGRIYVADRGNNRVLIFDSLVFLPLAGASASGAVGQQTTNGTTANWNSPDGLATAAGLYAPAGLYVDRQDTLYVGDPGNNRVVHFLKSGAVVNAATFQASVPVGQGALATLFGAELASDKASTTATPWPGTLMNRQIVINDEIPAPVYFVGPGQVNFQMPSNAPLGAGRVAVRVADTGELVAGGGVVIGAASPGIFTMNQTGAGQAAAVNQDGTINGPNNPAPAGSTIVLYGTGQGQVSPAVSDGNGAPGSPLAQTVAVPTSSATTCLNTQPSMCVAVGSTGFGGVQFSGLAPGFVGLWQINVTIPAGTPAGGAVPMRVVINGTPSNTVTVAVR
jgi:uncharacterized protein (TIGR03437 family)